MIEYKLETLEQFHKFFRTFRGHDGLGTWYRGQADANWPLLPKAGREECFVPHDRDLGRFSAWLKTAIAYENLPDTYIERLAVAQHHGLATRLLDWTKNPLVAAFFAVSEEQGKDGSLYLLECPDKFCTTEVTSESLTDHPKVRAYIPRAVTDRILQQQGMFTVHCPSNNEIEICGSRIDSNEPNLRKIIIPASLKDDILEMLNDYGVADNTLFPGLDGLSKNINRKTMRMSERARNKLS